MGLTTDYQLQSHLGIITDFPPEAVGPESWTGGSNVTFGDANTSRSPGWSNYAAANMPAARYPIYAGAVDYLGVNYWLWFSEDEIWVTNGTDHFDITPALGLSPCDPGDWTYNVLNGIPVFNNPNNPPMWWNLQTGTPAATLPDWPADAVCKSLRTVKYHLVALNITQAGTNYPSQVWWSESAQAGAIPQEWTPSPTNDAGDTILGDSPGAIVDGWTLRDQLIIYKNSSTYTMQYVAGQYIYAFRKLFPTIGAQSLNCACELDSVQYVFTGEDVVRHDGQNVESMIDRKVIKDFIASIDGTRLPLCCIVARVVDRQIWICTPITGQPYLSQALIINTDDGYVGRAVLPNVASVVRGTINPAGAVAQETWAEDPYQWSTDTTIWTQTTFSPTADSLMMTQTDANLLQAVGIGSSADGDPIATSLERLSMRVGEGLYHSVITQIVPLMQGVTGDIMQIRVGQQDFFNDPISWSPYRDFVIGQSRSISEIIDGRYVSLQFNISTVNEWTLQGYYLKTKQSGEY